MNNFSALDKDRPQYIMNDNIFYKSEYVLVQY